VRGRARQAFGKPTTRRYSPEEKAAAVRMVSTPRAELGTEHGTVQRVASLLGYGVESVRTWVKQADMDDGVAPGVSSGEAARVREQEVGELRRANEMADSAMNASSTARRRARPLRRICGIRLPDRRS
jgi:transposase